MFDLWQVYGMLLYQKTIRDLLQRRTIGGLHAPASRRLPLPIPTFIHRHHPTSALSLPPF